MSSREWFQRGEEFLEEAESALSRGRYWLVCFASHQAAEFYLKGKLVELCGSYTFTHDLTVLARELSTCSNTRLPDEILIATQFLSPHYTGSRYPGARSVVYDESLARNCLRMAREIIQWVRSI